MKLFSLTALAVFFRCVSAYAECSDGDVCGTRPTVRKCDYFASNKCHEKPPMPIACAQLRGKENVKPGDVQACAQRECNGLQGQYDPFCLKLRDIAPRLELPLDCQKHKTRGEVMDCVASFCEDMVQSAQPPRVCTELKKYEKNKPNAPGAVVEGVDLKHAGEPDHEDAAKTPAPKTDLPVAQ
ncbi:MAG: hypothetical protein HY075_01270 [Deltaproteobacteria bacterium]|nr:hypothetical protein [Deltaproteobacteria bacterium]